MKKLFGIALVIVLSTSVLAGCGKKTNTGTAAATDMPAAAPDADLTPAGTDTETDTEEITITSAIDLTAYPVMWCQEYPLYPEMYDSSFKTTLASEIYDEDDVLGTQFVGFRLIDDTHIERFTHIKLNDDIDASLLLSSEECFKNQDTIMINDRETDLTTDTWGYEINGIYITFILEQYGDLRRVNTNQFSPDFTSYFNGQSEYTYRADF